MIPVIVRLPEILRTSVFSLQRLRDLWEAEDRTATAEEIVRSVLDPDRWVTYGEGAGDLARSDIERLRAEALALLAENDAFTLPRLVDALRFIDDRAPLTVALACGPARVRLGRGRDAIPASPGRTAIGRRP